MHAPDDDLDIGTRTSDWGLSRLHAATSVRWVAKLLAWVALLTGAAALCEYGLGRPLLDHLAPALTGMSPLTAMALAALALSLPAGDGVRAPVGCSPESPRASPSPCWARTCSLVRTFSAAR